MRLAKAKEKDVDTLRIWMQFNDALCEIDTENEYDWRALKKDWEGEEDFAPIIKWCDKDDYFSAEGYFNYYRIYVSHIHGRITLGYTTLVDNCCDPDLDYLDFNKEIKEAIEK